MTTGGFSSAQLKLEEEVLALPALTQEDALTIGQIAYEIGSTRDLAITIEVRLGEWTVFHASLPGSKPENDEWIARKARVVLASGHSTIHERVLSEETNVDWYELHNLPEKFHAIHGGGLPLNVIGKGLVGILLISGLPQVDDHLLGVEIITEYLARKGEQ
jgi:uncharacterized protein (UPF0303 family)